ncbi:MAG: amidohydrolase [Elusimicrobia bacterium CG_4_10_14_0_8_um_filter_37_32]|nr:MAG: amidohydrolase [Elusimicrobia bacterium CG_4_10_14_0_8_um_filter_37_32]
MIIIDIHTHFYVRDKKKIESIDKIVQLAKRFGIEKICVLGDVTRYGYDPDEDGIRKINDLTISMVRKYPNVFIGFCFLNPKNSKKFIYQEIERCVIKEGFKGIKLEVAVNARDKRLNPIINKAEELNVVVLHHAWYKTVGKVFNESDPSDIAVLAARFPKVKIIMAHLTGCGIRGVLEIQSFPNVYVDTSGSQPFSGIVEYAVEKIGARRLLFGSDMPYRDFSSQLGRIYGAKIKESERRLILGLNAQYLLGF